MNAWQDGGSTAGRSEIPVVVVLRPLATSLPVSFLGLAAASATFSGVELHWVSPEQGQVAALVAILVTVPLQALAAVVGFLARDPVAGTGCALLSGAWGTIGAVTLVTPTGSVSPGLGLFLLVASVALVVPVAAGWSKPLAAAVMAASGLRFLVTGLFELSNASLWQVSAGVLGLALAGLAAYAALAFELEGVHGRAIVPTWRHGDALAAGEGMSANRSRIEPGVRDQL